MQMKKNDTIWQMPSGLKMLPQPQDVYINTGGSGTLHAPTKQQSISSYTPLLDERHLTAFLGHIPESVDDEFIIQLLTVCGELRCWKRARDPYGFAVFEEATGLLNALRFIAQDPKNEGIRDKGIFIQGKNGNNFLSYVPGATDGQKLIFCIDLLAKNHCEIYRRTMRDDSSLQETQDAVNSVLATLTSSSADAFLSETLGAQKAPDASTPTTPIPGPVLSVAKKDVKGLDYRDIINAEIQSFRDGSVRHDLQRQKEAEEARRRLQARMKRDEEASVGAVRGIEDDGGVEWDSEEEGRKREKRRRSEKDSFREKEERFEKAEAEREKKREREEKRDKEVRDKKDGEGEKMKDMLSGFDDDEAAKHEFYTDRQRNVVRSREEAQDIREKREEERVERRASDSRPQSRDRTPPRRDNTRREGEEKEEMEIDDGVEKILTMEQRQAATKAIIATIPIGRKELFAYPIKWEYADRKVMDAVEAGARKKLAEYVEQGAQFSGTLKYVMRLVRDRTDPEDMMGELVDALDESEAEGLLIKIVRMIVYETEARRQGLL